MPTTRATPKSSISVRGTKEEIAQIRHAAKLSHVSAAEFIRRAVNKRLQQMGVDAVLFKEKE